MQPTHILSASTEQITLYSRASTLAISSTTPNSTVVELIDEYVGEDCFFSYVKLNDEKQFYVDALQVVPLPETKRSAPYRCPTKKIDSNYEMPNWTLMRNRVPFLNTKNLTVYVSVVVPFENFNDLANYQTTSLKTGLKCIFDYYNKEYTEEQLDYYLRTYFKFAKYEDYQVMYNTKRIRVLISLPVKYLNSVKDKDIIICNPTQVFSLEPFDLLDKINYLIFLLNKYSIDIGFNYDTLPFSIEEDIEKIEQFLPNLKEFLNLNGIEYQTNYNHNIEFTLDDCNRILQISYNNGVNCRYPMVGFNILKDTIPFSNPRIINYFKFIDKIYRIDSCTVPWYDFFEKFAFVSVDKQLISNFESAEEFEQKFQTFLTNFSKYGLLDERDPVASKVLGYVKMYETFTKTHAENPFKNLDTISEERRSIASLVKYKAAIDQYIERRSKLKEEKDSKKRKALKKQYTSEFLHSFINNMKYDNVICNLLDALKTCLLSLVSDALNVNLATTTLSYTEVSSLSLDDIRNLYFPSLVKEQQTYLLNTLLIDSCLTKRDIINLIKTNNMDARKLSQSSEEEIKQQLITKIVGN